MKKLRGKKRQKAHKKRLEQSLNVLFHPSLKKTPIINTKYKLIDNQLLKLDKLSTNYVSTFEKINSSLTLNKLSDYIDIIYNDSNIIAINKPAGILSSKSSDNTLDMQNILKSYIFKHKNFADWKKYLKLSIFDKFTKIEPFVGVLHRLDKSTSGIIIYSRHLQSSKEFINLFSLNKIKKTYIAVIKDEPPKKSDDLEHYIATTKHPIVKIINYNQFKQLLNDDNGDNNVSDQSDDNNEIEEANVVGIKKEDQKLKYKKAVLHYRHLQSFTYQRQQYSVLRINCFSGRQHQVRAQLSYERMPIIGDTKYKSKISFIPNKNEDAIALHAWLLEYKCPFTKEYKSIEAPLPDYWNDRFGSQIHTDVFDHN